MVRRSRSPLLLGGGVVNPCVERVEVLWISNGLIGFGASVCPFSRRRRSPSFVKGRRRCVVLRLCKILKIFMVVVCSLFVCAYEKAQRMKFMTGITVLEQEQSRVIVVSTLRYDLSALFGACRASSNSNSKLGSFRF